MTSAPLKDSVISDVIDKDIIELLGLTNLPKEKQDEYREKATETIYDRAFTRITNELEEKGLIAEFEKVAEDEATMQAFLIQHGIDQEKYLIEETLVYKAQMKSAADILDAGVAVATKSE